MNRKFSLDDKLATIEVLIVDFRWARDDPLVPEFCTYWTLKALADDVRGRQRHARFKVIEDLQGAIDAANASKTRAGFTHGHLRSVAERLMGAWSTVLQALEHFAAVDSEIDG